MRATDRFRSFSLSSFLAFTLFVGSVPAFPQQAPAQQPQSPQSPQAPQAAQNGQQQAPPATIAALRDAISALLDQPRFASARWGVLVVSSTSGEVVFARDEDKSFTPASNMKLYTTAAALDALGPDFKIETSVYATRPAGRDGILRGDLILYGRGDPNLSSRFEAGRDSLEFQSAQRVPAIEVLADDIKRKGIRRIVGDVIGDDSYFACESLGAGWEWDDAQFYYGAEISALTVNDNAVTFTVQPAIKAGLPPIITVSPETSYLSIINNATTTATGTPRIGVNRPLNTNVVEFFGSIPRTTEKTEINIAVHDPAAFAATLLREALARRGITVSGKVRHTSYLQRMKEPFDPQRLEQLATFQSRPLSEMLRIVNKPSQNLHTELFLRQLGAAKGTPSLDDYGRPRMTDVLGNEVRRAFLEKAGVALGGLSLRDGSGLSRQDLVTPRATVKLLTFMSKHQYRDVFRDSLPVAGVDGTLERRMKDTGAAGNARAKTGTLAYVNALSGYVKTRSGEVLIFSMFGNNYVGPAREVTQVLDRICTLLADFGGEVL